jgi:carboxymethylenebutenolidase
VGARANSLQVPANRLGYGEFTGAQLKTIQEIITLLVFAGFSVLYLGETLRWNHAAGFVCLVPDLFWRQEPGVELSDRNPDHIQKAFDLYYDFDYDLGVRDMEDTRDFLRALPETNGKVGAVGYCLGGKLCYLMCCRTDIDCAVAYYGTYIEHNIREAPKLAHPFMLHMAMKDRWVQAEVNELLERRLAPNPLVSIHKYPEADHAFARKGGRPYREAEAAQALSLSVDFLHRYLDKA